MAMNSNDDHISDRDLLLEADGELDAGRIAAVRAHLAACWWCRARRVRMEDSITGFVRLHREETGSGIPPADGPRALLRARLAGMPESGGAMPVRRVTLAAAIFVALLLALWAGRPRDEQSRLIPDAALTPGVAAAVDVATLCATPETDPPAIEPAVAHRVFEYYGIRNPAPRRYELDYLITPALGGLPDSRNLWPQPYAEGEWNSRIKDALEDRLRSMVCAGHIDLTSAQREIAGDWIAAYRKHFRTERPLLAHMAFVKDRPWE
jgi:anti-sigma factor RsiW